MRVSKIGVVAVCFVDAIVCVQGDEIIKMTHTAFYDIGITTYKLDRDIYDMLGK